MGPLRGLILEQAAVARVGQRAQRAQRLRGGGGDGRPQPRQRCTLVHAPAGAPPSSRYLRAQSRPRTCTIQTWLTWPCALQAPSLTPHACVGTCAGAGHSRAGILEACCLAPVTACGDQLRQVHAGPKPAHNAGVVQRSGEGCLHDGRRRADTVVVRGRGRAAQAQRVPDLQDLRRAGRKEDRRMEAQEGQSGSGGSRRVRGLLHRRLGHLLQPSPQPPPHAP